MKTFIFLTLLIPITLSGKYIGNEIIKQDIAIRHSAREGLTDKKFQHIQLHNDLPVAYSGDKAYKWNGTSWENSEAFNLPETIRPENLPKDAGAVLSSILYDGKIVAGTEKGLFWSESGNDNWERILPRDENYSWSPVQVSTLAVDTNGRLWIGAQQGVGCLSHKTWKLFTGEEGLPYNQFTCSAAGPEGIVWFGTKKGAIRYEDGRFYYRFSLRWLPDDYINDIAVQEDGTAWFATNEGIGQIESKELTFDQKAKYFTYQTETRHQRMGFIAPNELTVPYDTASFKHGISDNDGKYTSMYGAAQAYRYAITGAPEAKHLATRSFEACKWLVDITHEPGFPARVIIPHDWPEPLADPAYSHQVNLRNQQNDPFWKDINPRFVKSKDGKYLWKCDTSSDELAGHYYFYGIYYDLVAETEEEKAPVRQVVADITDHLIRNGFYLRDHDGKATRWGNFSPEFFNSIWGWDQRGLNSLMMLSFLNVASHITGDSKYEEVAEMLRSEHKYHINAMHGKEFFPPDNVVPWDNNLCLMSMYGLMNYEKNPELLIMYRMSLENSWLHISKQNNAYWNTIYAALANYFAKKAKEGYFDNKNIFPEGGGFTAKTVKELSQFPDLTNSIKKMLEQMPLDLIGYEMDNTHRLDVQFDPAPGQKPTMGWHKDGYALPIDERGHVRQDRDGFALQFQEVGGVNAEQEGTFFLLPYYMAQYYNLLK